MVGVQEFNELLRKIKYDEQAREVFCFEYYNLLKKHVSSKFGDFIDSEDVVQDVIEKLIQTDWTEYDYIHSPVSWLYSIVDNRAKDLFKKFNRILEFKEESFAEFNPDSIEMRSDVLDAINKLSSDMQYVLYHQFWMREHLKTIAENMGKTYGAVRALSSRARKKLKKILKKRM